jgi:hypothetical protein
MRRRCDREEQQAADGVHHEEPAPPMDAVLRLQHAAGNRAVVRLLAPRQPTVARAIKIGNERYTHGSARVVDLFKGIVVPELESKGYKVHGIKTRLVDYIRDTNAEYGDSTQFLAAFMPWLAQQKRRVRDDKETDVLKPFSVSGMSRPAWPEALKTLKGLQAGDNVRHVVRNATLKRSLEVEMNRVPEGQRKPRLTQIAKELGIDVPHDALNEVLARQIYDELYLNPENLFAGDGPVNQVIGFAADPVRDIGEELIGRGDEPVDIVDVYTAVMKAIYGAANKVKANEDYLRFILHEINAPVQEAIGSLRQDENNTKVVAEEAGELVADIGLGFGFDLVDGRTAADTQNIAQRQGRLLWTERALQAFVASNGTSADVLVIYKVFMGRAEAPTQ